MGKQKEYGLSRTGEEVKRNVWNFLLRTSGSFNLNSEHLDGEWSYELLKSDLRFRYASAYGTNAVPIAAWLRQTNIESLRAVRGSGRSMYGGKVSVLWLCL